MYFTRKSATRQVRFFAESKPPFGVYTAEIKGENNMKRSFIRFMGMAVAAWGAIFNRAHAYTVIRSGFDSGVGYDYVAPSKTMSGYRISNIYLESWWTCSGAYNASVGGGNLHYGYGIAGCNGYYMCDSTGIWCSAATGVTSSVLCCRTSGTSSCSCTSMVNGGMYKNQTWTQYDLNNQYYIIKGCTSGLYYDSQQCITGYDAYDTWDSSVYAYSSLSAGLANCCYPCPHADYDRAGFNENTATLNHLFPSSGGYGYWNMSSSGIYYNCARMYDGVDFSGGITILASDWCWTAHDVGDTGDYTNNGISSCRAYPNPTSTTFNDGKGTYTLGNGCPWQN